MSVHAADTCTNSHLQMTGSDTLHAKIARGVACIHDMGVTNSSFCVHANLAFIVLQGYSACSTDAGV